MQVNNKFNVCVCMCANAATLQYIRLRTCDMTQGDVFHWKVYILDVKCARLRDFKFYLHCLTVNISSKPLVFPNKLIHVGSCQVHYVVISCQYYYLLFYFLSAFSISLPPSLPLLFILDIDRYYYYGCCKSAHFFLSSINADANLRLQLQYSFFWVCVEYIKRSCHTLRILNDAINNNLQNKLYLGQAYTIEIRCNVS